MWLDFPANLTRFKGEIVILFECLDRWVTAAIKSLDVTTLKTLSLHKWKARFSGEFVAKNVEFWTSSSDIPRILCCFTRYESVKGINFWFNRPVKVWMFKNTRSVCDIKMAPVRNSDGDTKTSLTLRPPLDLQHRQCFWFTVAYIFLNWV